MTTGTLSVDGVRPSQGDRTPVRLLKFLTTFYPGGTERQVLNLARHLDGDRFDLSFACMSEDGDYLDAFADLGAPITEFGISGLFRPRSVYQQLRFASFLRKQRIEIMHSYNFHANAFAVPAARLAGVPVVVASVRDRGVYLTPAQTKVQRWACGLADHVLVNAESIRDWLLELGLNEDRITVIKNGIDLTPYQAPTPRRDIRREFDISDSAPIVILVARLNPQKGIEDFIRAAAQVAPQQPDARFLIVGTSLKCVDGEWSEAPEFPRAMKALAQSLGVEEQVIFAGHRDDVPDLLSASDISVLPSLSEGLSNTLLESMAAGLPIIATDVGGNPELVKEGINGRLVPVQAPDHLAQAMQSLLADPEQREKLGARGRIMAREEFSLPGMADRTQRVYLDQLEHAKRSLA